MTSRDVVERLRKRRLRSQVNTAEGVVHVRGLSGRERDEYYAWIRGTSDSGASLLLSDHRIVAMALCDEDGQPLFASADEALQAVTDWNNEDVLQVAKEVLRLSGLNRGATDEAEKKS